MGIDAADRQVHACQTERGRVGLLPVDGEVLDVALVVEHEFFALHEHASAAATAVVDTPVEGLDHFHQELDDAGGRVELPAFLAFSVSELTQEVLVNPPEQVL